jgi:hypothetical protein
MVRHIYLWNVAEGADGKEAADLLDQLPGRIDFIRSWTLGPHVGGEMGGIERDYALICDFDSLEDVQAYLTHSFHDEVVAKFSPMVCDNIVVDLEIG